MSQPVAGAPEWHADPSGRHQYRWWDGVAFTDQVADNGVVGTDAGSLLPRPPPAAPSPSRPKLPLVLAAIGGVAVLGGGAFFVLGRDAGSSGTGTFEGTIDGDAPAGVHVVGVAAGSVLTVEVEPSDDLDVVVGLVVADDDADEIDDLYEDVGGAGVLDPDDAFSAIDLGGVDAIGGVDRVIFRTDVGFPGEDEQLLLAVPFDVDAQVVIVPFDAEDAGEGDYEVTIDSFDLEVDDGADVEDLLQAVSNSAGVPDDFRDLADELLTGGE